MCCPMGALPRRETDRGHVAFFLALAFVFLCKRECGLNIEGENPPQSDQTEEGFSYDFFIVHSRGRSA